MFIIKTINKELCSKWLYNCYLRRGHFMPQLNKVVFNAFTQKYFIMILIVFPFYNNFIRNPLNYYGGKLFTLSAKPVFKSPFQCKTQPSCIITKKEGPNFWLGV